MTVPPVESRARLGRWPLLAGAVALSLIPAVVLVVLAGDRSPSVRRDGRSGPNAVPVGTDDVLEVLAGEVTMLDVASNDVDADGDPLVVTEVTYESGNGATVRPAGNLVVNGDGSSGDDNNFSSFDYAPGAGPDGQGVFITQDATTLVADRYIPVDPAHAYAMAVWSRADPNPEARQFVGFVSYDADRFPINPWHVAYGEGTETELAADLAPGDTEIRLVDATGWSNGLTAPGRSRNIVMYPYTNSLGETYEPYTYSRFSEFPPEDGLWDVGAVEDDTIRLTAPWDRPNPDRPDGVWPAGTPVANAHGGPSFNYALASNETYTSDWVEHEAVVSGTAQRGSMPTNRFRPGTAFVRFGVIANVGVTGSVAQYADVRIFDGNLIAYEPAPGFSGTDTFSYTVSDGFGGTATARVTVDVIPNTDPVAVDDDVTVQEGRSVSVDVIENDTDADGDSVSVVEIDYDGDAVVAFGGNLVTNGDGSLGDNTNFPDFELVPGVGPDGAAAFATDRTEALFTEEAVPVDLTHTYVLEASSRARPNVGARQFLGFASYDADDLIIEPWHVFYGQGTETELAADLVPGDTEILLEDASRWSNDPDQRDQTRNIVLYPYTDAVGTTYEPYTYSRHTKPAPPGGLWEPGAIDGDTIALQSPWDRPNPDDPFGIWPAGTPVANAYGGPTYNYVLAANDQYTSDWVDHSGVVAGVASGGRAVAESFRPGTAWIRFAAVVNRDVAGSVAQYANVSIRDASTPVTYEPAPGFTGTDEFTYTIRDTRGGVATGTVRVTVVPNTAPTATDDTAAISAGEVASLDVVSNDVDADGDPLVVVEVAYDSGNGAIVEVDGNLMTNGDGAAGDNTNFSSFEYVDGAGPDGQGAFAIAEAATVASDEFVPVDLTHEYGFSMWSRADPGRQARHFAGFISYDADRLPINAWNVFYGPGTETVLAADLALGDTEIQLENATNWSSTEGAPGRSRNIVMYPYTNSLGETYEPYTYSRHSEFAPADGLWDVGAIEGDTIRLTSPWSRPNPDDADGVWPAGTLVANARGGPPMNYVLVSNDAYTARWVQHRAVVAGVGEGGFFTADQFRPGTAFIRFGALTNQGGNESVAQYADIRLTDLTAPVTYRPAPGFVGTDTFTYVIGDDRGGTDIGTVTVEVAE